jgi:hypothetical protein
LTQRHYGLKQQVNTIIVRGTGNEVGLTSAFRRFRLINQRIAAEVHSGAVCVSLRVQAGRFATASRSSGVSSASAASRNVARPIRWAARKNMDARRVGHLSMSKSGGINRVASQSRNSAWEVPIIIPDKYV